MSRFFILFFLGSFMSFLNADELIKVKVPQIIRNGTIFLNGEKVNDLYAQSITLPPLIQSKYRNSKIDAFSKIEVLSIGDWILFRTQVIESGEIITNEGANGSSLWLDDNISFNFEGMDILCNPLGAVNISLKGQNSLEPVRNGLLYQVARIYDGGWQLELAIHKSLISINDNNVLLKVIRERQQRGFHGFRKYENAYLLQTTSINNSNITIVKENRQTFNGLQIVEGCYVNKLPETIEEWMKLPSSFLKPFSGGLPVDSDFQKTEIRIAVSDTDIGIYVINYEKNIDALQFNGDNTGAADEVEIFLGPEGFNYIQLVVDGKESIKANKGKTGGRRVPSMPVPKSVVVARNKNEVSWSIQLKISVQEVLEIARAQKSHTPKNEPWRLQIVRNRPDKKTLGQKAQESILVVTGSSTAHAPLRFAQLHLNDASEIKPQKIESIDLPKPVFSTDLQKEYLPSQQVGANIKNRQSEILKKLNDEVSNIKSMSDWEVFKLKKKDQILNSLFPDTQGRIPDKGKLQYKVVYQNESEGILISGLLIVGRTGLPITVTMFESKKTIEGMKPCLVLVPAHHTGRNSNDLYTVGKNFCDAGGVVLTVDTLGSGERGLAPRWNHINHQRNLVGLQYKLAGEEILGGAVADLMTVNDYLYDRKDIDKNRIGLVGGVAGGGDITAFASLLDERYTVTIPFNFSHNNLIDGWYDYMRSYPGSSFDGVTPWLVCALHAPRHYIMAEEFAWSDTKQNLLDNTKRIYSLYGKEDRVEKFHGWAESHALHFNYMHRIPMNQILNKWWNMSLPVKKEDEKFLKLNEHYLEVMLTETSAEYVGYLWGFSKRDKDTLGDKDLEVFNRSSSNSLMKDAVTGEILREPHIQLLEKISDIRKKTDKKLLSSTKLVKEKLNEILGNTLPVKNDAIKVGADKWNNFDVTSFILNAEDSFSNKTDPKISFWILSPKTVTGKTYLCVSQEGKSTFLFYRKDEILKLLNNGSNVVLIDVRNCGETAASEYHLPEYDSIEQGVKLWQFKESLLGQRVKDLRSVLASIVKLKIVNETQNVVLWGEGFSEPNGTHKDIFRFEETGFRQASPEAKHLLEAMGPTVCIMAALLTEEAKISSVVLRSGLSSFESILYDRFYYVPHDLIVPGLLRHLDLPILMQSIEKQGINLMVEDMRDAKNRVMDKLELNHILPAKSLSNYSSAVISFVGEVQ